MSSILFTKDINCLVNIEENKYKNIYFLFESLSIDEIEYIKSNIKNSNITFCILNSSFLNLTEQIILLIDKFKVVTLIITELDNINYFSIKYISSVFYNCSNLNCLKKTIIEKYHCKLDLNNCFNLNLLINKKTKKITKEFYYLKYYALKNEINNITDIIIL
jgi:hypothetical protein